MRGVEAEATYNRRWLMAVLAGSLLVGVLAATWMLAMAERLPPELAAHWNGRGEVDGYLSLGAMAVVTVALAVLIGGLLTALAIATRSQNLLLARLGVGLGLALGIMGTALMLGIVIGQIDLLDASRTEISGPVVAAGLAAGVMVGAASVWWYRPGEVDRTADANVLAMDQLASAEAVASAASGIAISGIAAEAVARATRAETMTVKVTMGRWAWLVSAGLGAMTAAGMFLIRPPLALLGLVVGALVWVLCTGVAVIGPEGVKVLAGGFWKLMPLSYQHIAHASVADIKALDYGGWGYRMTGGAVGFIMASGPAVVMETGFHQRHIISMPTVRAAGDAAALINAYVLAATVKN